MERILELLEEGIREGRHKQRKGEIDYKLLQRTKALFNIK